MGIILPLGQGKPAPDLLAWLKAYPAVGAAIIWEDGPVNPLGPDPVGPFGPPFPLPQYLGPRNVYTWGGSMQLELIKAFQNAWGGVLTLGTPEPKNIISLADADEIRCGLSKQDAWSLYIGLVGWSLAAELSGQLGWTITGYGPDSLALLFDSRQTFHWRQNIGSNPLQHGYEFDMVEGELLPAPAELVLEFIVQNGLIGGTTSETIVSLIEWAHQNLWHYGGGDDTANIVDQWQYRGFPPLSKVLAGTPDAKYPGDGIRHRTAGCWGTAGFFHSMLRVINVPARAFGLEGTGHMTVQFPSEGLYLSHGDDPYDRSWSSIAPVTSPASLLIDQAQFDAWFNGALSDDQRTANVGRQPLELALANLSNWLLHTYWDDQSAGHGHADGDVAQAFDGIYSVAQLEAMNLWNRMDAKIAALGGIGSVPNWRPQPTDAAIPREQGSDGLGMAAGLGSSLNPSASTFPSMSAATQPPPFSLLDPSDPIVAACTALGQVVEARGGNARFETTSGRFAQTGSSLDLAPMLGSTAALLMTDQQAHVVGGKVDWKPQVTMSYEPVVMMAPVIASMGRLIAANIGLDVSLPSNFADISQAIRNLVAVVGSSDQICVAHSSVANAVVALAQPTPELGAVDLFLIVHPPSGRFATLCLWQSHRTATGQPSSSSSPEPLPSVPLTFASLPATDPLLGNVEALNALATGAKSTGRLFAASGVFSGGPLDASHVGYAAASAMQSAYAHEMAASGRTATIACDIVVDESHGPQMLGMAARAIANLALARDVSAPVNYKDVIDALISAANALAPPKNQFIVDAHAAATPTVGLDSSQMGQVHTYVAVDMVSGRFFSIYISQGKAT